jgi:hypothetical protein
MSNNIHFAYRSVTIFASQQYTFSVYARAAELRYLQIFSDEPNNGVHATFDLVAGRSRKQPQCTAHQA